jgi:hypothetical protein
VVREVQVLWLDTFRTPHDAGNGEYPSVPQPKRSFVV